MLKATRLQFLLDLKREIVEKDVAITRIKREVYTIARK
jgi:hypothetical protein